MAANKFLGGQTTDKEPTKSGQAPDKKLTCFENNSFFKALLFYAGETKSTRSFLPG
jgi:hypothetical protein